LICPLVLGGCASSPELKPAAIVKHQSLVRSAHLAFRQGQYAQAATLYQAVLEEALAEDDPEAIVDARFNLALSQTYLGRYEAALAQVEQAEAERVRRGLHRDPDLQLLLATIHYRAGNAPQAASALDALLRAPSPKPTTRAKAHFLAGLMAADRRDAEGIRSHIAAIDSDATPGMDADRLELKGRLAGLADVTDKALTLLDRAVVLRRIDRDYRGMVRALATAGDLAERAQRRVLAGNYLLRAGRSAAQRSEPEAREWLERARDLGKRSGDSALVSEAEAVLAGMVEPRVGGGTKPIVRWGSPRRTASR
jgi:tetratricopeptide (TPR) repeat protein